MFSKKMSKGNKPTEHFFSHPSHCHPIVAEVQMEVAGPIGFDRSRYPVPHKVYHHCLMNASVTRRRSLTRTFSHHRRLWMLYIVLSAQNKSIASMPHDGSVPWRSGTAHGLYASYRVQQALDGGVEGGDRIGLFSGEVRLMHFICLKNGENKDEMGQL